MLIDCDRCVGRGHECHDCVVSFLLADAPAEMARPELTSDEVAVMGLLAEHGVVPPLRLRVIPGGGSENDITEISVGPRAASR